MEAFDRIRQSKAMGNHFVDRHPLGADQVEGGDRVGRGGCIGARQGDLGAPEQVVHRYGDLVVFAGTGKEEHRPTSFDGVEGLGNPLGAADDHQVCQHAVVQLPQLFRDVPVRWDDGIGAESPGHLEAKRNRVHRDDPACAHRPGGLDVELTGDAAPHDEHGVPRSQPCDPLPPYHTAQGLDEGRVFVGDLLAELEYAPVHVDRGDPDEFAEASGIKVRRLQGLAGAVVPVHAVVARVAGYVVGNRNPIARAEGLHIFADLDHFARHFVAQDQGGLVEPIPLHAVAAA